VTAIKSQHTRIFEQRVAVRRQEILESMALGHQNNSYWSLVGQIQGLDDALKISEEADFTISGDEDPNAGA
jgi:hypothetical protein